MIKLNWRKYPDTVPEQEVRGCMKLCIVRIQYINGLNELDTTITYDWYNPNVRVLDEYGNEDYVGQWTENDGLVTHYFYADELPPPEEIIMKYFSYDHHGNGVEYHDTAEEAKNYAQECLDSYIQNDNLDDIDICWGEITEAVHSNDAVLELKPTSNNMGESNAVD